MLDSLLFSIALAVGLTPQLLPAIININLSKGSQAMAANGVIVRRLASIENFGSMDVLCTDKTGTLTEGIVQLDGALDVSGQASDAVFRYAFLNAHFQTGLANPLDEAILAQSQPDISNYYKTDEIPYDFVRKRLSVVVQEGGGKVTSSLLTSPRLNWPSASSIEAAIVEISRRKPFAKSKPFALPYSSKLRFAFLIPPHLVLTEPKYEKALRLP